MVLSLLWSVLQLVLRLGVFVTAVFAEFLASKVYGGGPRRTQIQARTAGSTTPRAKVAVVGAGIAGSSCAWALEQDGFNVHLFEADDYVGGNAKTFLWPDGQRTGLSVLAWPELYFHNYNALLKVLKVEHTNVGLGFHIRDAKGRDFIQGDRTSPLMVHHRAGIARWERMVTFVRGVNAVFNWFPSRPSLYDLNMLNPLNLLPLRWLSIVFGVSRECWDDVIVPMYASTFLTTKLDYIPAIILPIISDIIPLTTPATLRSWKENSSVVFDRMLPNAALNPPSSAAAAGTPKRGGVRGGRPSDDQGGVIVHLETAVVSVEQDPQTLQWTINGEHAGFDRVVFSSNAKNVRECTGALPDRFRLLFDGITYTQEEDTSMVQGKIHSNASIFPFPSTQAAPSPSALASPSTTMSTTQASLLETSANFIQARQDPATGLMTYTNTFILSSWIPALGAAAGGRVLPRLVTYGAAEGSNEDPSSSSSGGGDGGIVGSVWNQWNHPALSPGVLAAQWVLQFIQGRRGVYFCGSLATPGNGHDLSLCSGLAVAHAIGAAYPFADTPLCASDFRKLWGLMGLRKECINSLPK